MFRPFYQLHNLRQESGITAASIPTSFTSYHRNDLPCWIRPLIFHDVCKSFKFSNLNGPRFLTDCSGSGKMMVGRKYNLPYNAIQNCNKWNILPPTAFYNQTTSMILWFLVVLSLPPSQKNRVYFVSGLGSDHPQCRCQNPIPSHLPPPWPAQPWLVRCCSMSGTSYPRWPMMIWLLMFSLFEGMFILGKKHMARYRWTELPKDDSCLQNGICVYCIHSNYRHNRILRIKTLFFRDLSNVHKPCDIVLVGE